MTTDLLTTLDASRLAGVSPETIRLWRRSGRLVPAVRVKSGLALYTSQDVERVVAERRCKSAQVNQRPVDEVGDVSVKGGV